MAKPKLHRGIREFKNPSGEKVYKVQVRLPDGSRKQETCHTYDEALAILGKAQLDRHQVNIGMATVTGIKQAEAKKQPLQKHVDDFEKALAARQVTPAHVERTMKHIRRMIEQGGMASLDDVDTDHVTAAVKAMKDERAKWGAKRDGDESRTLSHRTIHHYLQAIREFSKWLVPSRLSVDPLSACSPRLFKLQASKDPRHTRRALTLDEAHTLIATAEKSEWVSHGMTGHDRAMLYRVALGTGFRANEIRHITPARCNLAADPPTITVPAGYTKNGDAAEQIIRPELAAALRDYLKGKPEDEPIFPVKEKEAYLLQHDLIAAGLSRKAFEGVMDFHALRHTYASLLIQGGADVKLTQEYMRHKDPMITLKLYTHVNRMQLRTGAKLPNIEPPKEQPNQARKTG